MAPPGAPRAKRAMNAMITAAIAHADLARGWWHPGQNASSPGPHADAAREIDFVDLNSCFNSTGHIIQARLALRLPGDVEHLGTAGFASLLHRKDGHVRGLRLRIYRPHSVADTFELIVESGELLETMAEPNAIDGHDDCLVVNISSLRLAFSPGDCLGWSFGPEAPAVIAYSKGGGEVRWHRPALDHSWDSVQHFPGLAQRTYALQVFAQAEGGVVRRSADEARVGGNTAGHELPGTCGCKLAKGTRSTLSARMAAALRVLKLIHGVEYEVEGIWREAHSSDAATACPEVLPRGASSAPACEQPHFVKDAGDALRAWGIAPIREGLGQKPEISEAALQFADASPMCVPGTMAVAMICSLVALAQNCYALAVDIVETLRVYIAALLPCLPVLESRFQNSAKEEVEKHWDELASWLKPSQWFLTSIWDPLLASNRWWLGEGTSNGSPRMPAHTLESASACSGVIDSSPEHRCHGEVRGAGPGLGVSRASARLPWTRVLGVGPMKAGSTVVWQALGAATQLPMGQDCELAGHTDLVWRIDRRFEPLWELLEGCSEEVFKWELTKDPMMTNIAGRLQTAWPALSLHGRPLRLYFLVRSPFDCVRAFIRHLFLRLDVAHVDEQRFSLENLPRPTRFTRGKQLFLDVERDGLRYTGYIDAAVQRWVLAVDRYLHCPQRFALIRYEDFLAEPVEVIHLLVQQLGLDDLWSEASADRVREAVTTQYQPRTAQEDHRYGQFRSRDFRDDFGPTLHARIYAAVEARAFLLGYGSLLGPRPDSAALPPSIDVPPVPTRPTCDDFQL